MKKDFTILPPSCSWSWRCAVFAAETTFNGQYRIRAFSNWNFDKKPGAPDLGQGPLHRLLRPEVPADHHAHEQRVPQGRRAGRPR